VLICAVAHVNHVSDDPKIPTEADPVTVGLQHYNRADLEAVVAAGQRLQLQVVGLARLADDVTPELALA
jgi:hypothetical protein